MCAAIAAAQLHEEFVHVEQMAPSGPVNKLYKSWVQDIDMNKLLTTRDLERDPVISLLDSTVLDEIAERAFLPGNPAEKTYVSDNLAVFISLTNLRGVPYSVDNANGGSFEEHINYYADQQQFEVLKAEGTLRSKGAKPVTLPPIRHGGNYLSKQPLRRARFL